MSNILKLQELDKEIPSCSDCLVATQQRPQNVNLGVCTHINYEPPIMIVTEIYTPAFAANRQQDIIEHVLKKCEIDISDVYFTKLTKCKYLGSNNKTRSKEIKNCLHFLEKEIDIIKPKVIITFNAVVTAALIKERAITKINGNVFKYKDCFVVPTYDVNTVDRNRKMLDVIVKDVKTANSLANTKPVVKNHIICYDKDIALSCLKDLQKNAVVFSCDIESTGLSFINDTILGIGFSYKRDHAFYIPIRLLINKKIGLVTRNFRTKKRKRSNNKNEIIRLIEQLLADLTKISILQNGKFDNLFLKYYFGFKAINFMFDTMLMGYLLDVNARHDLKSMATRFPDLAGYDSALNTIIPKNKKEKRDFKKVPIEVLGKYCCFDVEATRRLLPVFYDHLVINGLLDFYQTVLHPLQDILCDIEFKGVDVDKEALKKLSEEYYIKVKGSEKAVHLFAQKEFNINSSQQVAKVLFKQMKIKSVKKTPGGADSTDEEVLRVLSLKGVTIAQYLLDHRKYSKINSTYVKGLSKNILSDGKIHTNYNAHITKTLRLSSSRPNLQNVPRKGGIREVIIPPKDHCFLIFDYAQIELKVLCFFSKDPVMLKVYKDGLDIHAMTGLELFGKEELTVEERVAAKTTNFGITYGIHDAALAKQINDVYMDDGVKDQGKFVTEKDAGNFIYKWFNKYKGARHWIESEKKRLFNQGYAENYFGVRRELIKLYSTEKRERAEALREGISTIVQGTAACYINKAIVKTVTQMKKDGLGDVYPTLPVHDEIAFVAPKLGDEFLNNLVKYISKELTTNVVPEIENIVKMTVDCKIADRWGK